MNKTFELQKEFEEIQEEEFERMSHYIESKLDFIKTFMEVPIEYEDTVRHYVNEAYDLISDYLVDSKGAIKLKQRELLRKNGIAYETADSVLYGDSQK